MHRGPQNVWSATGEGSENMIFFNVGNIWMARFNVQMNVDAAYCNVKIFYSKTPYSKFIRYKNQIIVIGNL